MLKHQKSFEVQATKKTIEGRQVFTGILSNDAVDRSGEMLIARGAKLENYRKNPVILGVHNYQEAAVGKAVDIRVEGSKLIVDFIFAKTPEGDKFEYLYANGFMKALSVGFLRNKYLFVEEGTEEITIKLGDGTDFTLDLRNRKEIPDVITYDWEVLEGSVVPVPCNQEALVGQVKSLFNSFKANSQMTPVSMALFEDNFTKLVKDLDALMKEVDEQKAAVPKHTTPIIEEAWDSTEAIAMGAKWASSDGSGDKDTIDWGKFAKLFTWYEADSLENFTSYKLPHHTIQTGTLTGVRRGIFAAMGALLGARGGVDLPESDRKAVYNHLASHYSDMEVEAPEFKTYTEEELTRIMEGNNPTKTEETTGTPIPAESTLIEQEEATELKSISTSMKGIHEALEVLKVKLTIALDMLAEQKTKQEATETQGQSKEEEELKMLADIRKMFGELKSGTN